MNKFLIIHTKFDKPKTAKFRAKMKSMSVLESIYLGQFLSDLSKLGLKIYVKVCLTEIKINFDD